MDKVTSVDEYFQLLTEDQRELLGGVRAKVLAQVPGVVETISYNMPTFKLRGKPLLHMAAWKKHCSVYPIPDAVLTAYAKELEGFTTTKGSLHFTTARPIPPVVLEALIQEQVALIP